MSDIDQRLQMKRRSVVLAGIQLTGLTLLTGRLMQLQFVQGEAYRTQAEGNRIQIRLTAPSRGMLLDRNRAPLAENESDYRVLLERESRKQTKETWDALKKIMTLSENRIAQIEKQLSQRRSTSILIKDRLIWDDVAKLEFHRYRLPALRIEQGEQRSYPLGEHAAHLVGYVRKLQEKDTEYKNLRKLPHLKIGRIGVEHFYEQRLRGMPGAQQLEVNATGVVVRELSAQKSKAGQETQLTIDAALQRFCSERMGKESACAVVMDAHKGDILAMASTPSFDPNIFTGAIPQDYWQSLQNERKPQLNKAIAGQYPPGSTFKMLVALEALQRGIVSPYKTVFCPGHYYLGNQRFNCWKAGGHGRMNAAQALVESCDTYFYEVANELGIDAIATAARRFGLGEPTTLQLLGEEEGLVPTPEWKRERRNQKWNGGDTINASIGQGFVLATPVQLAVMMARMVNGGKAVNPRLLMDMPASPAPHLPYDEEHLELLRRAMVRVVYSEKGTAYGSRPRGGKYSYGGKTGTSQVRRITQRGMDQSRLPWNQRHHALFTAFAPAIEPKWVASVVVEHGGSGSAAAAPIARDIMQEVERILGDV